MSNKENREPENGYTFRMGQINFEYETDEDTEDASETAIENDEEIYCEIKDEVYHDKLADLKNQMKMLSSGIHPAYLKGVKELKEEYDNRQFLNKVFYTVEVQRIKKENEAEHADAYHEFHQKQEQLKENIIADLEEKRKIIEAERDSMEINSVSDTLDFFQNPIRKLRRRANDPLLVPEPKRRKSAPCSLQLKFLLAEDEISEDLNKINEVIQERTYLGDDNSRGSANETNYSSDIRVENGKLYYEKYWFHRGQQIYYEESGIKNSAVIATINPNEVWVRRTSDNEKHQIYISQLLKGAVTLKRRSA